MTESTEAPQSEAPRYEIRTIADFLKVPEDRLDACLDDFRASAHLMRPMADLVEAITEDYGEGEKPIGVTVEPQSFVWIDDGVKHITLAIKAPQAQAQEWDGADRDLKRIVMLYPHAKWEARWTEPGGEHWSKWFDVSRVKFDHDLTYRIKKDA